MTRLRFWAHRRSVPPRPRTQEGVTRMGLYPARRVRVAIPERSPRDVLASAGVTQGEPLEYRQSI